MVGGGCYLSSWGRGALEWYPAWLASYLGLGWAERELLMEGDSVP